MKIRMRGSSVRYRLTQGEAHALGRGETLREVVAFGPSERERLVYAITPDPSASRLSATFVDGLIDVRVPASAAREWSSGAAVALTGDQAAAESVLAILVEKDFACLTQRPGDEDRDAFPHPEAGRGHTCS